MDAPILCVREIRPQPGAFYEKQMKIPVPGICELANVPNIEPSLMIPFKDFIPSSRSQRAVPGDGYHFQPGVIVVNLQTKTNLGSVSS